MSSVPALQIRELSFQYRVREEPALDAVSFDLAQGEMLLIAGASGCGKTTLARCINGLIPRSYKGEISGEVLLYGQQISEMTPTAIAQSVGTLLQDPERQIVGAYVANEIAFGLENLGVPREEMIERIDAILAHLGISHLRERDTFNLSGGEKQKVALAGALVMEPSILLLDEPLASLDPASAREALALFRSLADEGKTVVVVEHRVEDVLGIHPDRVLYMEAGQIRYLGKPDGLAEHVNYQQVKLPAPLIREKVRTAGLKIELLDIPPASPDSPPALVFEGVNFAYPEGPLVLHDINLTIRQGDVIAVLGPNGAGKSTLVKHAIGLLKPTEGHVTVMGRDTRKMSVAQNARSVGYVFQSPTQMLFAATVKDELAFGPKNLELPPEEIESNVAEAVQVLNLTGLEEYSPLALSFGQQKRTGIASILAMHSSIIVMDEPTAGQDYANYTQFMRAIVGSGKEEQGVLSHFAATLFITHDLDLAVTYANRVILVSDGRIAADGRPEEVLGNRAILDACRVVPTSLLALNQKMFPVTRRFMSAEALAAYDLA